MAALPKNFYRANAPVTGSPATITVPASMRWIVTNVVAVNGSTSNRVFSVSIDGVPLVYSALLVPGAIFTLDCAQVVDTGKQITVSADGAAAVGVHISGVEADI